jgi:hypothetical protein
MTLAGFRNMRPTIRSASSDLYREQDRIGGSDEDSDRLPIHIAAPVLVALCLSLWGGIGFAISALL